MNIFSYIKTKLNILDVVGEYTNLKRAGTYWKGKCPFHNEKTASFTVSPHKEIFYCFGCHTGGDVIAFISKVENLSQIEAAKHLASTYQIELPESLSKELAGQTQNKEKYFTLCQQFANWCHEQLTKSPSVIKYLQNRGFTDNSINMFNLGYFPGGQKNVKLLTQFMSKSCFILDDLTEFKILTENQQGAYSPFEERIIFPIKDIIGRSCGFGGRVFKEGDDRAKYYNSHENAYFNKGSLLFGFDVAKKTITKSDHVFIVEGYTDCIAMAQHGFTNTVATLGTACTHEHLKILSRYVDYVYVLYDGDEAGKNAIMRLTELCWQENIELKAIILPPKEDPASFLKNNGNLNELIGKSTDIFEFFIDTVGENFLSKNLSDKLKLANEIINTLGNIRDPLKRAILSQKASKALQMPIESIQNRNGLVRTGKIDNKNGQTPTKTGNIDPHKLEKKVFSAIINNVGLINVSEELLLEYLPLQIKNIYTQLRYATHTVRDQGKEFDFGTFFDTLGNDDKQYISKLLLEFEGSDVDAKTFEQLLLQFQKKYWKRIVKDVTEKLEMAKRESNNEKVGDILQKFCQLKKKILRTDLRDTDLTN